MSNPIILPPLPEPEPVALESVHLTRDTRGMCVVRVNGRVAIRDNGDIIDHMATLEWFAAPPAAPAPVVPLQGGMDNNELLAAWQKKLPGKVPEGQELNAFAVGTEVGFEHAQRLERMDWDRVHHVLAKHGKHPGRTDDHLADVIDKALSAAPVVPLTEGRITAIANELAFGGGHCNVYELARAIEAAHGITGGSK